MSVTVKYKGSTVAELTESGTKTLKTSGKYCESDIVVENTKDGGAGISAGVVFDAVDSKNQPTECTLYGTVAPYAIFGTYSVETWTPFGFRQLKKVKLMPTVTTLARSWLTKSNVEEVTGTENVTNINYPSGDGYCFDNALALKSIALPKVTRLPNGTFCQCTSLETVSIGSVGYSITTASTSSFNQCTQSGLVITIYTTGENADAFMANIRNGATNATIIVKAAEDTEYNGTAYAAGGTIITSIVETEETA